MTFMHNLPLDFPVTMSIFQPHVSSRAHITVYRGCFMPNLAFAVTHTRVLVHAARKHMRAGTQSVWLMLGITCLPN